jgi:flagellin-like hook-associated protein FlgL
VQDRRDRLAETDLTRRELLSRLEDADYSATILEYQTLQNSLQAQLQTSAQLLNLSLFDFLR